MKRRLTLASVWAILFAFTGTLLMSSAALAAPAKNPAKLGQALEIAPPVINVSANPGQTIKTTIYLRDVAKGSLIVTGQTNDFVAGDENGTPKLLLKSDETSPYSLKNWVGTLPSLRLVPREIKTMAVSITVPKNASPGGHYGVIRFTATPADLKSTGVSLSASLGALVLLRVNGKVNESLSVKDFYASHGSSRGSILESAPLTFTERLQNDGNVHVAPTGQVTVKNMFGKTVGGVNVNAPPRNILPGSIRKFEQAFDQSVIGNKKLFGKYTANLKLTYGDSKKTLTDSITFWVIPYKLIAALAILLVAGFFVLRELMRRYNRRIIEKSRGGPPRPPASSGPPPVRPRL